MNQENLEFKQSKSDQITDLKKRISDIQEKFSKTSIDQLEADHDVILAGLKKRLSDLEHTPDENPVPGHRG